MSESQLFSFQLNNRMTDLTFRFLILIKVGFITILIDFPLNSHILYKHTYSVHSYIVLYICIYIYISTYTGVYTCACYLYFHSD